MADPILVLPPDERGDQQVQRRHGRTPVHQVLCLIQPFGMLVEHRVKDVDECLIGGEQAMPTRQHIAFQPAFQCLFTQDFHDAPGGRQVAAVGIAVQHLRHPGLTGGVIDRGQPVAGGFVGPKHAEPVQVHAHHLAQIFAKHLRGLCGFHARLQHGDLMPGDVGKV
ncbi:hypothetical protein G6F65_020671 [Rhizopus arrhizus]|nr:hypothetical protein G6F65_020671 [Rhizopus arrhizus]